MSSPPQRPPAASAPPAAASPPPPAASQPLHRAFVASSSPRRASATPTPPLFTGRPINPNPSHASAAHGILYPVVTSSSAVNHRRAPPVAAGFPRAHAVAVPIAPQHQPLVSTQPRSFAAVPRAVVAGVASRPEQPPRGVPIAPQAQPKVNPVTYVTPSPEMHSNSKDKETSKEDSTTMVINDRKVHLLDSESGSLYALCRSWVRNGVPHESQPSFGNGGPSLPRPLPASVVDSRISEKDNDAENGDPEEQKAGVPSKFKKGPLRHQELMEVCFNNSTCTSVYAFMLGVETLGLDSDDDDADPLYPCRQLAVLASRAVPLGRGLGCHPPRAHPNQAKRAGHTTQATD